MSADEITLRLPREREFFGVARLVVGGLAVRLGLSFDQLEDLQVAVGELLEHEHGDHDITLSVRVDDHAITASLGPFGDALADELAGDSGRSVLRRVLEAVVDRVEVHQRDGTRWVELTKARV